MGETIHEWFELTYASYLVLPRSILQSMPEKWQERFVELLREADRFGRVPRAGTYEVRVRDEQGRYTRDDLRDYDRGRRYVESLDALDAEGPNQGGST